MTITFDSAKRDRTLAERGLDFADAGRIFDGPAATLPDDRQEYGEPRFITGGWLDGRFVVVVWTPRDGGRRIISMRHGHGDEERRFREQLG
jgi:uncharacterized protein